MDNIGPTGGCLELLSLGFKLRLFYLISQLTVSGGQGSVPTYSNSAGENVNLFLSSRM